MDHRSCAKCHARLTTDNGGGFCPACLLEQGLVGHGDPRGTATRGKMQRFTPPSAGQLAPFFSQLEIHDLLGAGGMGAVYRARQKALDRVVALKILPAEVADDPAFAERFTREAKTLARLNHPHIVTLYEFGQSGSWFYLLMEFVDGINLRTAIQTEVLEPAEALAVVQQICDALQYAHEEGIVHRDIKPENILLDQRGRVKIADFGLAKLLDDTGVDVTLTQSQQIMGTWYYMAPEQWERPHEVDHRADLYSLGVVFYELLTGQIPVGRFALPSQKRQLDPHLDQVVLKALEREPQLRYQHASDFKTDLDKPPRVPADQALATSPPITRPNRQPNPAAARPSSTIKSIPFTLWNQGTEFGSGLLRGTETHLILEYELTWSVYTVDFGRTAPGFYETGIPWERIASVEHRARTFGDKLVIQADSVIVVKDIPNCKQGIIELSLKRKNREDAEAACQWISQHLGANSSHPSQPFHRKLRSNSAESVEQIETPLDKAGWVVLLAGILLMAIGVWVSFGDQRGFEQADAVWYWLQGTLAVAGGIAVLTRAEIWVARVGIGALCVPVSWLTFVGGLVVAIWAFNAIRQGPGAAEFSERKKSCPEWLRRWLGLGAATGTKDDVPRKLLIMGTTQAVVCGTVIWGFMLFIILMTFDEVHFWNVAANLLVAIVPSLFCLLPASAAGVLAVRRSAYGMCVLGTVVGMLVIGIPQVLLLPFSIGMLVTLLSRDVREWFGRRPSATTGASLASPKPAVKAPAVKAPAVKETVDSPSGVRGRTGRVVVAGLLLLVVGAFELLTPLFGYWLVDAAFTSAPVMAVPRMPAPVAPDAPQWPGSEDSMDAAPAQASDRAEASSQVQSSLAKLVIWVPLSISVLTGFMILGLTGLLTIFQGNRTAGKIGAVFAMLPLHPGVIVGFPLGGLVFWLLKRPDDDVSASRQRTLEIPPTTISR